MKKLLLLICVWLVQGTIAQTIAINSTGASPATSAALDADMSDKGMLIPRVTLTTTSAFAPVTGTATVSLVIYNTATAGTAPTNVTPGYYYWNGASWSRLLNPTRSWETTGNTGTVTASNFIGPTSAVDFVVRTNNTENMRVQSGGNVGIGEINPVAKLDVYAGATSVNTIVNATGSINDFLQFNVQNIRVASRAQSGYSATADNGSATTGFAWIGINNSTFSYPTTYNIGVGNDVSLIGSGQDLYIANAHNTKSIIFSTGKAASPYFDDRVLITNSGNVGIGTNTPGSMLDIATGTTVVNSIVNAKGSINDFLQFNVQNTSTGTQAKSGYTATADNGTTTTGFAWLGINNSTFNFISANDIGVANDVSCIGNGEDLYIANAHNTKSIIFSTGKAASPYFNERLRITNGGFVGIGTTAPTAKLDMRGVKSSGSGSGTGGNSDAPSQAIIPAGFDGTSRFYDWPSGWSGGLSTYDIVGSGTFFSTYATRSDLKLKRAIKTMDSDILVNFIKIRPVTYFMKDETIETAGLQYGFIAQEVREIFPSIVTQTSDSSGIIGMNYQALIAPTIYALQQQVERMNEIQDQLNAFEIKKNLKLTEMNNLKKLLATQPWGIDSVTPSLSLTSVQAISQELEVLRQQINHRKEMQQEIQYSKNAEIEVLKTEIEELKLLFYQAYQNKH